MTYGYVRVFQSSSFGPRFRPLRARLRLFRFLSARPARTRELCGFRRHRDFFVSFGCRSFLLGSFSSPDPGDFVVLAIVDILAVRLLGFFDVACLFLEGFC